MASSNDYLQFIVGQLSELEAITYRAMMGELIKIFLCIRVVSSSDFMSKLCYVPIEQH
jgi:phosphoserine phosphatase